MSVTPVAETLTGAVEGAGGAGVTTFRGIPFAAAPTGALRFRPPQPHPGWSGRRDGRHYGPISPQNRDPLIDMIPGTANLFFHPGAGQGEDCLSVNVWTPSTTPDTPLPVFVWIHGGAFLAGSGTGLWTDGANLAREEDVVVVSMNYRLGALGGAVLDVAAANNMLLDQIAALEWVRDNIAAFGGDPGRVTVGGESAGGMAASALLCAPRAHGLFQQAIVQSGHPGLMLSLDDAARATHALFAELGADAAAVGEAPVAAILAAQSRVSDRMPAPFRPVTDGHVVPAPAADMFAAGRQAQVPLLVGTNADENNLFAEMGWGPAPDPDESLTNKLATMFESPDPSRLADLAQRYLDTEPDPVSAWRAATTDCDWRLPVRAMADAHAAAGNPVFGYEFTYRTPVRGGRLGSCHALSLPFLFGNLDQPGVAEFVGDDPGGDPVRRRLNTACRKVWGSFIRTGEPSASLTSAWKPYDPASRALVTLGVDCELVSNRRDERLDALQAMHPSRVL